jgi:hypothetical protein
MNSEENVCSAKVLTISRRERFQFKVEEQTVHPTSSQAVLS